MAKHNDEDQRSEQEVLDAEDPISNPAPMALSPGDGFTAQDRFVAQQDHRNQQQRTMDALSKEKQVPVFVRITQRPDGSWGPHEICRGQSYAQVILNSCRFVFVAGERLTAPESVAAILNESMAGIDKVRQLEQAAADRFVAEAANPALIQHSIGRSDV